MRLAAMGARELNRVRKIALALPDVNERMSHGAVSFFVRDKRPLATSTTITAAMVGELDNECQQLRGHGMAFDKLGAHVAARP